jgi:hypothetical protein
MYGYPFPSLPDVIFSYSVWLAVLNSMYLAVTIVSWALSDQRLLRKEMVNPERHSAEDRKQFLQSRRDSIMYFQHLPLFVDRSPLRIAMHRSSAPALAPVLAVLVIQSVPVISLLVCFWYTLHGSWHVYKFLEKHVKEKTPDSVKRVFFTAWF